jgi:hypothetical protein
MGRDHLGGKGIAGRCGFGLDSSGPVHGPVAGFCEYGNETKESLDCLSDC